MRHRWMVLALLAASSVLAVGQLAVADDAQVAGRTADQLNAQWAPNSPAFTPESVANQRGPDKFGGWGGVLIGNLIAVNVAKSMLAAPNNTLTPDEALTLATQQVMDARQGQGQKGWGRISQDLTGQKLGPLMKGTQSAALTEQELNLEKGAKGVQKSADKASGKTEKAFSNAFDTPTSTGVAVSGPGVGGGTGRGHDKDAGPQGLAGKDGGQGLGEGHGGGSGGGGGGGKSK